MKKNLYTIASAALLLLTFNAKAQIISTVAGTGTSGFSGDGAAATSATLSSPGTSAVDASGNIYIADKNNNRIRKVSTAGIITTFAGKDTLGYSGDGGAATAAKLNAPLSVCFDAAGNLYIADFGNSLIRKVNTSGIISTVAGTTFGLAGDGAAATAAQINSPTDVAMDAAGNMYICDYGNSRIRKVNTAGIISTVAGTTAGFAGDGGPATDAQLMNPNGMCVDAAGNIYIADLANVRIRKVDASGTISTIAGSATPGYTGDGGPATNANLGNPAFITTDGHGNVVFSDMPNQVIRKIDAAGTITTIAGSHMAGYSGDGGSATAATMNLPTGVTYDASGNLYITCQGNNNVRKVTHSSASIGNNSESNTNNIKVFPNPTSGMFTIELPEMAAVYSITITDVTGKIITTQTLANTKQATINLNSPLPGNYIIRAASSSKTYNSIIEVVK